MIITLTTDYGTRDAYAGVLKGVILGLAPKVTVVDITHDIEPHNVRHGAFVLRQIWPWYPPGTIHVAVVDPGVGTERRILLGQYAGQFVIATDNGLLTFLHRDFPTESAHVIEDRRFFSPSVSSTFHGRDIMAPVAAHLANGAKPREFGRLADHLELLPVAHRAEIHGDALLGAVLYVDGFGTLVTNIRQEQLAAPRVHEREWQVTVNEIPLGALRSNYSEVSRGEALALLGSSGHLEIAVNQGRAVERFGPWDSVRVEVR